MTTQIMDLDGEPDDVEPGVPTLEEGGDADPGIQVDDNLEIQFDEQPEVEEEEPKGKAESDEDDLESLPYGERVKRRIQRERDVTRREREARMAAEERLAKLEAELEYSRRKASAADIDSQITEVRDKIKEAQLADDPLEVAEHTATLANLKREKDALEAPAPKAPAAPAPNKAQQAWIARNPWFDTKEYDTQSDVAVTISEKLKREGYDPNSDEFWEEIDSRMADAGVRLPKAQRKPQPVAGVQRDTATTGKKLVRLDASDLRLLESMGIDRNDKAALREYALNKMNRGAR